MKNNKKRYVFWTVLIGVILLIAGFGFYKVYKATSYNHVSIDRSDEALGIGTSPVVETTPLDTESKPRSEEEIAEQNTVQWNGKIINIALFGLDRRSQKEVGRSDSMMILTLDFLHNKIKLTSLMRDLDVPIEKHGTSKLNHAYAFGGPELAIKTINQNFGTDVRDYVSVDFFTLEKIIDVIGGVQIDVKAKELNMLNEQMNETAGIQNKKPIYLKEAGMQTLNGMQAVSYARIRYVGNGDFERTERQRRVIMAMVDQVKEKGASVIPSLLLEVSPYIETSLDRQDILSLAYKYFKEGHMEMEQERYPLDGSWKAGFNASGGWIMKVDMEKMKTSIQNYIYQDINPTSNLDQKS